MNQGPGVSRSDGQPVRTAADTELGAFLERVESMAMLERLLDDIRSGSEGRLVLVGGEAGVGKTTLLRRFCERHGTSARILWGACEPLRTPRPLGPLLDIAEATGGELAHLVEGVARPFEVAAGLVRELGARGPTVVVLEDLHWADEATLDVLTLLAGRIASTPALVLASYRDDELGRTDQLRLLVGEVIGRHGRLKLEPLSRAGVAELAEQHGIEGAELYRRTQGNPFFVTEVLAAGGEQISETVRDAVLARANRLSERARRLLDAIAIVPGTVDLALLEAVAGELVDDLEECLASGVLTPGSAHVAFRHELARLAIEEAVAPNRRLALHRGALAALAARAGEHPEFARLAHHADAAGDGEGVLGGRRARANRRPAAERIARRPPSTCERCDSPTGFRMSSACSCWRAGWMSAG